MGCRSFGGLGRVSGPGLRVHELLQRKPVVSITDAAIALDVSATTAASRPCYPPAMQCPFCQLDPARIVARNALAIAVTDGFPVNPGHTLLIPLRHVASWFDATPDEQSALFALLAQVRADLDATLHPSGYNIGINVGPAAGQTVMHLHVHLIPRFDGDVDDPRGGVRFVIPSRGNYRRPGHVPQARE